MKGFLLCVIALTSTLVKTEEPMSEKPISELQFYRQILEFNRTAGRLPETTLEQEARFKEMADEFQTEFAQRFVEFDAVITDATWSDGWATIKVVSKHPRNSKTPPGCLLNGRVGVTSSTDCNASRMQPFVLISSECMEGNALPRNPRGQSPPGANPPLPNLPFPARSPTSDNVRYVQFGPRFSASGVLRGLFLWQASAEQTSSPGLRGGRRYGRFPVLGRVAWGRPKTDPVASGVINPRGPGKD